MVCDIGGGTTELAVLSLGDTVAAIHSHRRRPDGRGDRGLPPPQLQPADRPARRRTAADQHWQRYPLEEERRRGRAAWTPLAACPGGNHHQRGDPPGAGRPAGADRRGHQRYRGPLQPGNGRRPVGSRAVIQRRRFAVAGTGPVLTEQTGFPVRLAPEPLTTVARGMLHLPSTPRTVAALAGSQRRGPVIGRDSSLENGPPLLLRSFSEAGIPEPDQRY